MTQKKKLIRPTAEELTNILTTPQLKDVTLEWYDGQLIGLKIRNVSISALAQIEEQARKLHQVRNVPEEVVKRIRWVVAGVQEPELVLEDALALYEADSTAIYELSSMIQEHSQRMAPWDWGEQLEEVTDLTWMALSAVMTQHGFEMKGADEMPLDAVEQAMKDFEGSMKEVIRVQSQKAMETARAKYRAGIEDTANETDEEIKKDSKQTASDSDSSPSASTTSESSPVKS